MAPTKEKTKYRTVNDGYVDFLEYEATETYFFGLFTRKVWRNVWRPYYDKVWGRSLDSFGYDRFVCTYNNAELRNFKDGKWPYIEDYFKWATEKQKKLEDDAKEYWKQIEKKKNQTKYF